MKNTFFGRQLVLASALALGVTSLAAPTATAADTWSTPSIVKAGDATNEMKTTNLVDGKIMAAFSSQLDMSVYAARSTDSGATYAAPAKISGSDTAVSNLALASSAGGEKAIAAWKVADGNNKIRVAVSDSTGKWAAPQTVDTNTNEVDYPAIAVSKDGSKAAIAYFKQSDTFNITVWTVMSTDGGATWGQPKEVSTSTTNASRPQVAMSENGSTVTVMWGDSESMVDSVKMARTTNGGTNWTRATVASGSARGDVKFVSNGDSSKMVVVWVEFNPDQRSFDLRSSASADGGATWSDPKILGVPTDNESLDYLVASSDASKVAAMFATADGSQITGSSNSGSTWSPAAKLTDFSTTLAMSGDGSKLFFVGTKVDNPSDLSTAVSMSAVSTDAGATWSPLTQMFGGYIVGQVAALSSSANGAKAALVASGFKGANEPSILASLLTSSSVKKELKVNGLDAKEIKVRKVATLVKGVSTSAKSVKITTTCKLRGKDVSSKQAKKFCNAKVQGRKVTAKPSCTLKLQVGVVVKATFADSTTQTWKRAWGVKDKPRVKC